MRDGNVYTSAGVTAGIDLALGMIEEDHGRTLALRVARSLVVHLKRAGGQSQFSNLLLAQFAASPAVRLVQEWALENLAADLSVKALAKRAHMSERTFRRAFAEETGETLRDFVERIRIDAARGLFEEAQLSVQAVATRCGFEIVDNSSPGLHPPPGRHAAAISPALPPRRRGAGARRCGRMTELAGKAVSLAEFVASPHFRRLFAERCSAHPARLLGVVRWAAGHDRRGDSVGVPSRAVPAAWEPFSHV